jgi:hypothetical protein
MSSASIDGATGWLDPANYPFCAKLEAKYPEILAELQRVRTLPAWVIWRERPYTPPTTVISAIGDKEGAHWRLFGLYLRRRPIERNCRLCPVTAQLLAGIPKITKAAFACLEAGGVILPHMGHSPHNTRSHLGLIIPPGDSGMCVGGKTRGWEEGKVIVFNDNQVHEAWNRTLQHRYVLILDIDNRMTGEADDSVEDSF